MHIVERWQCNNQSDFLYWMGTYFGSNSENSQFNSKFPIKFNALNIPHWDGQFECFTSHIGGKVQKYANSKSWKYPTDRCYFHNQKVDDSCPIFNALICFIVDGFRCRIFQNCLAQSKNNKNRFFNLIKNATFQRRIWHIGIFIYTYFFQRYVHIDWWIWIVLTFLQSPWWMRW